MVCKKCGIDKPITEFYKDSKMKSGVRTTCKACVIEKQRQYYLKNTNAVKEYHKRHYKGYRDKQRKADAEYNERVYSLKTPCAKCGDDRLFIVDFHHIEPSEKSFNIYRKSAKTNFSLIEEEAKKCVCLCRNCHGEFHHLYGQRPKNGRECLEEYLGRKVGE